MSAELVRLEDLVVGDISYGIVQPGGEVQGGIPILRVGDIETGVVNTRSPLSVAPSIAAGFQRTQLMGGEVLVTLVGTVGRIAIAPTRVAGWNVARAIAVLRPKPDIAADWLALSLSSPDVQGQISSLLNTTVQPTLNLKDLRAIWVRVPLERERRAIGEVLGALDDKIAANSNLSRTLNDLAAEYFSQSVQAAGEGPTYGNIADVFGGGTPSTKIDEYWGGEIRWATPTDVTALEAPYLEDTSRHLTSAGLAACASELHPAGSILMTSRATIGAFALAGGPTAVNQGFIVVRPKDSQLDMWLFHEMQSRVSDYLAVANGATFLELSRGRFKTMPVRWAPEDVMRRFGAIARPLHGRARAAMHESRSLAALRDTLLPELMSGRLQIKDAERAVEEAL